MMNRLHHCNSCNQTATFNEEILMDGGHIALNVYMGNELDSGNSCNHTATFNEEFLMNSFVHKNNLLNKKRTCQSRLPLAAG